MKKGHLIKSTAIVMVVALISRVIGALRDALIANTFGVTKYTDAYNIAISIPDVIFMIVGLAISTSFLPMLSRVKAKDGKEKMNEFASNIINILLIISIIIFVISSFFPEEITKLIASSKINPKTLKIATSLTRIILINLLFLSVNACFTALLQVYEDFVIPSILGLFFNLPIILYLIVAKDYNIYGLTIANVIGNFFRVAVQIPSLYKHGFRYRFFVNFKDERVKRILVLIIPVVIGAGANSLNFIVDKKVVSGLGDGYMTILSSSQLLVTVINTMIPTAITSVIYPVMANRISEGNSKEFLEILTKTLIYLAILLIPISIGVIIYRHNIVSVVYMKYKPKDVDLTSVALLGYAIGVFFTGIRDVLNSTLFTLGQTKLTAKNGVIGVIINVVLSITLSKKIGIVGISLAASIAMMVTSMLLLKSIIKLQGELNVRGLLIKIMKIVIASAIMGLVVLMCNRFTGNFNYIISLIIGTAIGMVVYLIIMSKMHIDEVFELIGFVRKKG